jgi:hypothetical protein
MIQSGEKLGGEVEVCLEYQLTIGFERIGSVGNAIENGSRFDPGQNVIKIRVDKEIRDDDVPIRKVFEAPGGKSSSRAVYVIPCSKNGS